MKRVRKVGIVRYCDLELSVRPCSPWNTRLNWNLANTYLPRCHVSTEDGRNSIPETEGRDLRLKCHTDQSLQADDEEEEPGPFRSEELGRKDLLLAPTGAGRSACRHDGAVPVARVAVGVVEARDGLRTGQVRPARVPLRSHDGRFLRQVDCSLCWRCSAGGRCGGAAVAGHVRGR